MAARSSRVELLHDALELSADDRAQLAADLLASLDSDPSHEVDAAWTNDVRRRVELSVSGESTAKPWATLRDEMRERWGK